MTPGRTCLSLFGSQESICESLHDREQDAGMFEIRVDLSGKLDCSRIRRLTAKPLLFTARMADDLADAIPFADFLDAGANPGVSWPANKTIVSVHTSEGRPEELWNTMQGRGFAKIVFDTENYDLIRRLLQLDQFHQPRGICFAMGEVGAFSRVLSVFRGSPWMYASLKGAATAPGQFTIDDLKQIYRFDRFATPIGARPAGPPAAATRAEEPGIFGIVGDPVSHSRSPEFHNRRFAENELPWLYLPFPCKDLAALFAFAPAFGVLGFSITHPHKEQAAALVQDAEPEVKQLNSCNTVCRRDGKWLGTNTDVQGVRAILQGVPRRCRRAILLGAGGAARAAAAAVRPLVEQLVVLNRTPEKAAELAQRYQATAGPLEAFGRSGCDLVIQATSCGMREGEAPVDASLLKPGCVVIDAIYEPAETTLLQQARGRGCLVINGVKWFEAQAEAQFQWWRRMLSV